VGAARNTPSNKSLAIIGSVYYNGNDLL
jgi:hypothetical protein